MRVLALVAACLCAGGIDAWAVWTAFRPHVDATYRLFLIEHRISCNRYLELSGHRPASGPMSPSWSADQDGMLPPPCPLETAAARKARKPDTGTTLDVENGADAF
ncbi:hypothetical protein HLH34_17550 [Gluconacetobacter azotocaptans]|uniref:Uncharacterized protein n=1 Tax=Gluconacetobacter azotocaptans TaxID=142834 RepID=A0A7W4JVL8_9PROT|nr:hypothetical protein [Gluconacetobacter azotocaptans]MBB2191741.1 hypothetical protein [Gluconacetobacter azotocaptans]MBM9400993.1 hypothetical protein [Gluconacetobacter azotocaptans]GBQ34205.1 hypothetical protein AA13594_2830 [Gluconacetobacter azotocaptans DSM 13594]